MEVNTMNETNTTDLQNCELYTQLMRAIEKLDKYNGPKKTEKTIHRVDTKGTHTEETIIIDNPEYSALLLEREWTFNAIMNWHSHMVENKKAEAEMLKAKAEIEKAKAEQIKAENDPKWLKIVLAVLPIFGAIAKIWEIQVYKTKYERLDMYDENNMLTDTAKDILRR
jgi:hypothetical protein